MSYFTNRFDVKQKITRQFRVLRITNNPEEYDDAVEDSLEFPDLVEDLGDEYGQYILDTSTGRFYPDDEFFAMLDVFEFQATVFDYLTPEEKENGTS